MSYIDRHLLEGERIVFRTRLHWLQFTGPVLFAVLVLGPAAWLLARTSSSALAAVPVAVALAVLAAAYVRQQSSDFAVTNKRVMMKVGVLRTRSIELLLGKIEAIAVDQSLAGRLFGYGDIVVTGSGGTREPFTGIRAPLEFRRAVQSVSDGHGAAPTAV
jgi:uncharacterized membrane protein YdbT with pleckstrin-like domain